MMITLASPLSTAPGLRSSAARNRFPGAAALAAAPRRGAQKASPPLRLSASAEKQQLHEDVRSDAEINGQGRRAALLGSAALAAYSALSLPVFAEGTKVFVAGATGKTGLLVVKALEESGAVVVAGCRNPGKAKKLGIRSQIVPFDLQDDPASQAAAIGDAAVVVSTVGFVPGNPFKMAEAAKAVDNEGTVRLIDAAAQSGAKKLVLMSSILANGRAWGKDSSPGFVITNAFGQVLDQKIVAENYLRKSGIAYVVVRPGGLKDGPPEGSLVISGEDTLASGEITRTLAAQVLARAALTEGADNSVIEVVETGTCVKDQCPPGLDSKGLGKSPESWF